MTKPNRIDVHQHVVPPFWAAALQDHGGDPSGWSSPDWSPEAALHFMDTQAIRTGVLSLTAPGVSGWSGAARRDMARRVNAYTTELTNKHPGRFGNFATLPMPDVEGALLEIEHGLDDLKVDGFILLSNYEGHYLGDAIFQPVWAELARRRAVVFVHPGNPDIANLEGIPGPLIDYPFDTTRTAVQLVFNGTMKRHPDAKVILSHAGGFLPYASHRFAELGAAIRPELGTVDELLHMFKQFYFDTALSSSETALASLMAFAAPGHVLYGSDFPYAPATVGASFTRQLDACAATHPELLSINNASASALLPRLR